MWNSARGLGMGSFEMKIYRAQQITLPFRHKAIDEIF